MSKALLPPPNWLHSARDLAGERRGLAEQAAADDWLNDRPWAESLLLDVTVEHGWIGL